MGLVKIVITALLAVFVWRGAQRFQNYVDHYIEKEPDKPEAYRSALFVCVLTWLITFLGLIGLSYFIKDAVPTTPQPAVLNSVFSIVLLSLVALGKL